MNKTLTATIIAAAISTNAAAYEVTAPPDVIAASNLIGELSRDVLDFGPRCRLALVHDFKDKTPCAIVGQIAGKMVAPSNTVREWLASIKAKGGTIVTNLPDVGGELTAATEMLDNLLRLSQYGS